MNEEIEAFLQQSGWAGAMRVALTGDASPRRYARLTNASGATAILMMAGVDQKTEAFIALAPLLRQLGLAAPEVYASDAPRGLALLEDFGDVTFGKLIDQGEDRTPFDAQAAQALAQLHRGFKPEQLGSLDVLSYDAALFAEQAGLFLDYYVPYAFGRTVTPSEREGFIAAWREALSFTDALPRSLLLRDFMPDNAMLLAQPVCGSSFGVLDFQDAGIGPVTYDIASWCETVRRPGGLAQLEAMIDVYHAHYAMVDRATLLSCARALLAQRHTRVLGIWVRLHREALIPGALEGLKLLLKDEKLEPVSRWFSNCKLPL